MEFFNKYKLVICGRGGSGKDYFLNQIRTNQKYTHLKIALKTTTRPPRFNESLSDYNFSTNDKLQHTHLIIKQEFLINNDVWVYGFTKEEYERCNIILLTPFELEQIEDKSNLFIIYFNISDNVILKRLQNRNDLNDAAIRRFESDKKDFLNFAEKADLIITDEMFNTDEIIQNLSKITIDE
jgi:guanylate kinase